MNLLDENNETIETIKNRDNLHIQDLMNIQKTIQSMSKYNHIEVLKILKMHENITLNENNYGIFINLTELDYEVIEKLKKYITYINKQENILSQVENQKEFFKNTYFS